MKLSKHFLTLFKMSLKIDSNVARVYYSSFIVIINIEMKLENKHTKHFELKNSELFFRFS